MFFGQVLSHSELWGCGFLWIKQLRLCFKSSKYIRMQLAVVAEKSGADALFPK
jgi:hypothetical protein